MLVDNIWSRLAFGCFGIAFVELFIFLHPFFTAAFVLLGLIFSLIYLLKS